MRWGGDLRSSSRRSLRSWARPLAGGNVHVTRLLGSSMILASDAAGGTLQSRVRRVKIGFSRLYLAMIMPGAYCRIGMDLGGVLSATARLISDSAAHGGRAGDDSMWRVPITPVIIIECQ